MANGDVHACWHTAQYTEIGIDVRFGWCISKIDLCKMTILFLRQIECELIVNGEFVVAGSFARITQIMIVGITFFAVIAGQSFGAAIASGRVRMAVCGLAVAFALLAGAAVDWIAPVAGQAGFTIGTCPN